MAGLGTFAQQEWQQAGNTALCGGKVRNTALFFKMSHDIERGLALQYHQVVSGEHAGGYSLVGDQHMVNVAAYHGQQSMKHALIALDRDHWSAHDPRNGQLEGQCLGHHLGGEIPVRENTLRGTIPADDKDARCVGTCQHLRRFPNSRFPLAKKRR